VRGAWWVTEGDLDEDQKKVMALDLDGNYLVTGPPGSGKTNLLLLRAKYLVLSSRPNVKVLVFGRTLREFIAAGGADYSFTADKIGTSTAWMMSILNEFGSVPERTESFDEFRAALAREVAEAIDKRSIGHLVDDLLLDEAQDYTPEELVLFRRLSKRVFAAADMRQQIYRKKASLTKLQEMCPEHVPLRFHYRCGEQICKLADGIAKYTTEHERLEDTCNYDESIRPSRVTVHGQLDLEAQARLIMDDLRVQMKAYPGELLGVACPLRDQVGPIWEAISRSRELAPFAVCQTNEEGYVAFGADTCISVSTVHSAKGLEFRTLHIPGAEGIKKHGPMQRNVAYTAVTRAKTSLSLYHEANLPPFLEAAVAQVNPLAKKPRLRDVFGGT
jgi:superfamily I DNA/RNA helicase